MKLFDEITYRYFKAPWDIGAREELVSLVEGGRIKPCCVLAMWQFSAAPTMAGELWAANHAQLPGY